MFRFEKDMIPVLIKNLSRIFDTSYFTTEFGTGNGIADLVFTTKMNNESLLLNDYSFMSLFVKHFLQKNRFRKEDIAQECTKAPKLKKLLLHLLSNDYIHEDESDFILLRDYQAHTGNLISIEAKLKDWKSGYQQALRYQFFSAKSFLAYPEQYIHRVDIELLKGSNIGLISVGADDISIILSPKEKEPEDTVSYYFLSESFAKNFKQVE